MNYFSVCSGIEAATVAWHGLGWKAIGYSEIEKFPMAVLKHHYPDVFNFGDITKFEEWDNARIGPIDVLAGGTPCQSFSIAGKRQGLDDPRGRIMFSYIGIVERFRPQWLVWENVPGVLSSNRGRDFGTLLGALGKLGYECSFRILDAQWFGLPQRRKRVFLVGNLGNNGNTRKILFESESVFRNFESSKKTKQEIANNIENSITENESENKIIEQNIVGAIDCRIMAQRVQNAQAGHYIVVHGTQDPCVSNIAFALGRNNGRENAIIPIKDANDMLNLSPTRKNGAGWGQPGDPAFTLRTVCLPGVAAETFGVRRLTPRECERLQGFPDDYTKISWGNRSADQCPEGPRYKALGNSMAVPVMKWIGERINKYKNG